MWGWMYEDVEDIDTAATPRSLRMVSEDRDAEEDEETAGGGGGGGGAGLGGAMEPEPEVAMDLSLVLEETVSVPPASPAESDGGGRTGTDVASARSLAESLRDASPQRSVDGPAVDETRAILADDENGTGTTVQETRAVTFGPPTTAP